MSMQGQNYNPSNFYSGGNQNQNQRSGERSNIHTNYEKTQKDVGCGDMLGGMGNKNKVPKRQQRKLEGNKEGQQECVIFWNEWSSEMNDLLKNDLSTKIHKKIRTIYFLTI